MLAAKQQVNAYRESLENPGKPDLYMISGKKKTENALPSENGSCLFFVSLQWPYCILLQRRVLPLMVMK